MDVLTLRPQQGASWAWVLQTADNTLFGQGSLEDMPRPVAGTRIRLLLPGDWVTHATVTISAKSPRLIAQALPFALEDSLAEELEQTRIAHSARAADGSVSARVVNRARLDACLAVLAERNLAPDAVFSELDAIPKPYEGWVLLPLDEAQVLARSSNDEAMRLDTTWLASLLPENTSVHVINTGNLDCAASWQVTREPAPQGAWVWLHQHLREADGIDFLAGQGRGKAWSDSLRPWAIPAALAAGIVVAQLGFMLMQTHQSQQRIKTMQAEIEREAREAAPEVKRWVNPLAQLRQMAKGGQSASDTAGGLLPLLAALSPALEAQPTVKLGNLRYQAATPQGTKPGKTGAKSSGTLDVQLSASDTAALTAIPMSFKTQPRIQADLDGLRAEGGQAEARLRLKEVGG